jgi:hypothetical protein
MLNLTSTFADVLKKSESGNWRYIIKIEQTANDHVNMISNPGFESATGDDFDNWTEVENNNGTVEAETTIIHTGSQSVKCTEGAGGAPQSAYVISDVITVVAETNYIWTFFDRGDGTNAGKYRINNVDNGDIIAETGLSNTTATWKKNVIPFTTAAGNTSITLYQISKVGTAGAIVYFDTNHLQPASNYYYFSDQAQPIQCWVS